MEVTKIISSLILASTLSINSFVICDRNDLLKHKKHLIIGAYSLLGVYSAKKAWELLLPCIFGYVLRRDVSNLFPIFFFDKDLSSDAKKYLVFLAVYSFNIVKLALFSFLTYFSIKNIIQELKDKDQDTQENLNYFKELGVDFLTTNLPPDVV